ncbi:MAG: cytochrome c1 [Alphaproteobacteria bacterium]|nr:cytochrome c1 [Alphaproteobacteria bacterium]
MKKTIRITATTLAFLSLTAAAAYAAGDYKPARSVEWPFKGVFGTVDEQAAQRGFQVYKEVCSACHGLKRIAFRNLADIGFTEAEIKALAATYQIKDGPNEEGEMFERPGKPSDYFPSPFANENQARATHNGAYPLDLSLIVKARDNGANYLYSLLTGYVPAPADVTLGAGMHYNPYFPGKALAMAAPLSDGQVAYQDGTQASIDQMARDVTVFLQWAAEPEMEERKQMGIKVLFFLAVFTGFMFVAYRRLWSNLH